MCQGFFHSGDIMRDWGQIVKKKGRRRVFSFWCLVLSWVEDNKDRWTIPCGKLGLAKDGNDTASAEVNEPAPLR